MIIQVNASLSILLWSKNVFRLNQELFTSYNFFGPCAFRDPRTINDTIPAGHQIPDRLQNKPLRMHTTCITKGRSETFGLDRFQIRKVNNIMVD